MEIYAFEVGRLHRALDAWMREGDRDARARVVAALDPRFVMIQPDGTRLTRAATIAALDQVGGSALPGHRTVVSDLEGRPLTEDVALVGFLAAQRIGEEEVVRRASAVLRRDRGAPAGVAWVHLHQTWVTG